MIADFFAFLYPMVTFISLSAYAPQIMMLIRADKPVKDMCLKAWLLWVCSNTMTLGYAVFSVHDLKFSITAGISLLCVMIVAGLVAHNRYVRFGRFGTVRSLLVYMGGSQRQAVPVRILDSNPQTMHPPKS